MRANRERASAAVRVRPVRRTLPPAVDAALATPGKPLGVAVRREMEQRFGHDFGDVRVHDDLQASTATRLLDAEAFTSGTDIVFGEGRYRPEVGSGRWLIAHELVHTLQQGASAATSLQVSTPDTDLLEREADVVAARVVSGDTLAGGAVSLASPAARSRIARRARAALERLPADVPDSPEAVRVLADDIARLLALDSQDRFGRAKRRLASLAQTTRAAVATALGRRIPATAATRLRAILAELLPPGAPEAAVEAPQEPVAAEPADQSLVGAEPHAAEAEQAVVTEGDVAAESASSPAEPEAAGLPEDLPEPVVEAEQAVAEPELQAEVVRPEAEAAPLEVGPREGDSGGQEGGPAPAPETAEASGLEEDAADLGPAEDTEAETLEAHDEADTEGGEESADTAPAAEGAPEVAPEAVGEAVGEDVGTPEEGAEQETGSAPSESSAGPEDESEGDEPADPEPAPEEEEHVDEPSAAEMTADDEGSPAEPTAGDSEALEASNDTDVEAVPDEPADTPLGGDETAVGGEDVATDTDSGLDAAGSGGGTPIEDPVEPESPDLSTADPASAMEAAGTLPPARSLAALTGVDAAASRSVTTQRETLAEQPPELDRPTGAPTAAELAAETAATEAPPAAARRQRAPEPPPGVATRVEPLPPSPPPVAARVQAPQIAGGPQGALDEDGRKALVASLKALPVHDPALDVSPGAAPAVPLEGAADPHRAHAERDSLETVAREGLAQGRSQIVKPAGEQRLVPEAPAERLRATVPTTPVPAATAAPPASLATDAASVLARENRSDELRAAAKDAAAGMRTRQAEQAGAAQAERRRSQEQVTQLVRESATQQAERRASARGEVHAERQRWSTAEHELAESTLSEADTRVDTGVEEVARLKTDADKAAASHLATGEREADAARRQGEKQAAAERKRGEEKSSGVLGWLADKATALFDEIKAGITKAFEIARTVVRAAIEKAKNLAVAAIDRARTAIAAAIRLAADALIAIGDKLLAAFPGVRDRFRRAIEERVAKAQAAVNALAEGLKDDVQKALDGLGAALDAALGLLEKGLLLVVDGYRAAIAGVLKWADGIVKAFGAFAVLAKHVAANPKQWLRNLAASAKDGVRNHLWKAFRAAIKVWFWEKVDEVLGLGITVWNLLKKGGLSLARIGNMAWDAIKAAIPPTLIRILIEKLISLLIPAAAAVMLIIETLQAAWGTIQRVLEAFERFFVFLKAVRTGKAGPHFARAIAAAAVAVIDFVANWLLKRLRKPAGKIAKKLKTLAKKLGKRLKSAGKRVFGKLFGKRKKPRRVKGKPRKKPKPDKRAKAERRLKAAGEFFAKYLSRERSRLVVWGLMKAARLRWRVRSRLKERADGATLVAEVNPKSPPLVLASSYTGNVDIGKYRQRAAEFQKFLREYHELHHILPRELRGQWDALDIDWNHEDQLLELPNALHDAVHRPYWELDPARGKSATAQAHKETRNAWNVWWEQWLFPRLDQHSVIRGHSPSGLARLPQAGKQIARSIVSRGKDAVVAWFSARLRVKLWRFRLRRTTGVRIRRKMFADLQRYEAMMRTRKTKQGKPLNVAQLASATHHWVSRHVLRVMSGRRARKLLNLVIKGKKL